MYGGNSKSNDLDKYCAYQNCQKQVQYNKLKTGVNDPSITRRMKFARRINDANRIGKCTFLLDAYGNIVK